MFNFLVKWIVFLAAVLSFTGCDVFELIGEVPPQKTANQLVRDIPEVFDDITAQDIKNHESLIISTGDFVVNTDVTDDPIPAGIQAIFITAEGNPGKLTTLNSISSYQGLDIEYVVYSAADGSVIQQMAVNIPPTYIFDFETGTLPPSPFVDGDLQWNWQTETHCTFRAFNTAQFYILP